jgi:4-cresol dehydrogenase (hydroxylating)
MENLQKRVLRPTSEYGVRDALATARAENKSLFVTSGNWNWGYGETNGVDQEAIHLDLSGMNKIIGFDPVTGVVRIEPGVTQSDLKRYIEEHKLPYCVPNTGAGGRASLLGNALERGFGLVPIFDHAESLLSVRGYLADGSIYESAFREINNQLADCFSWGVGPQLDKLVSQSSWLIITEASIQLEKKSSHIDVLLLPASKANLSACIDQIRHLLQDNHVRIGSIKIFNQKQVAKLKRGDEWFITIVIYSHPAVRKKNHSIVKDYFSRFSESRKLVLNERRTRLLQKVLRLLPSSTTRKFAGQLDDFIEMINLASGGTSEVGYRALDTNYDYLSGVPYDMAHFKKKLIWLSPLCVLEGKQAEKLMNLIQRLNTHEHFRFNTYTWTVLNKKTLALVIPIIFDEQHEKEFWPWYESIHLALKEEGFIPYRFHVKMMNFLKYSLLPKYFKRVETFEKAFDPDSIIQRGKYS